MASDQRHKPRRTLKCFTEPGPCRKTYRSKSDFRYNCICHRDHQAPDLLRGFPKAVPHNHLPGREAQRAGVIFWQSSTSANKVPVWSHCGHQSVAHRGGRPIPAASGSTGETTAPAAHQTETVYGHSTCNRCIRLNSPGPKKQLHSAPSP